MSTKGLIHTKLTAALLPRGEAGGMERGRIWVTGPRAPFEAPHATRSEVRKESVSCFSPPIPY